MNLLLFSANDEPHMINIGINVTLNGNPGVNVFSHSVMMHR
jgi:hypothetical protein